MENERSSLEPPRKSPANLAHKGPTQPPSFNFPEIPQHQTTDSDGLHATRRFIAEDLSHNPDIVPPLADLVIKQIIENFSFNYSALPHLNKEQLQCVLNALPTDIPLKVVASTISDEAFWQRMSLSRWPVIDVVKHGNSWKRAFFENYLEQMIHEYVPDQTYPVWIEEALQFGAAYVQRLDIRELLPPEKAIMRNTRRFSLSAGFIKNEQASSDFPLSKKKSDDYSDDIDEQDDEEGGGVGGGESAFVGGIEEGRNEVTGGGSEDDEEGDIMTTVDHLDLGQIIAKLDRLTHLTVQYRVRNVGLDFDWSQFQFTGRDCVSFSKAIRNHTYLRTLELVNSRVDCEKCRVLVGHLLDHPSLVVLNLSHNIISDWGARALGKLINGRSRLECLDLTNNRLSAEGAEALSHALAKGAGTLIKLNLRLNRIRDEGASSIARSLLRNTTLRELNLAANSIGDTAILVFGQVLTHNSTLQKLDLSNNSIGSEAGKKFQECIASNQTLIYLDLRFTGIPQVFEFTLQQNIEVNDNRYRMEQEKGTKTGYVSLPGLVSVAVNKVKPDLEKTKPRPTVFSLQ
ncbi:Dynein regulatory complex subunit 5 [Taenia crassiceps]|uniref:Dynein regulatory complex subunit 5 n=1 Tax=Taenia crassiceps TaxID=6207 RepID=A0ABR4Q6I3_9CEST